MSAFVVSDETIAGMLQAATGRYPGDGASYYWNEESHPFGGNKYAIAQKLLNENYRSVNYRYGEDIVPHRFTNPNIKSLTPVEIIKLCNCYRYQSSETDDWEQTEAFAIVWTLRERAICNLPGYDDAKWGL